MSLPWICLATYYRTVAPGSSLAGVIICSSPSVRMEIASIVMNANNLIMTATLAPATDVIGVQAMLPATVR